MTAAATSRPPASRPSEPSDGVVAGADGAVDEYYQWMPKRRLRQYAIVRIVGGLLFASIFLGWMWFERTNVFMRYLAGGLVLMTAWVTAKSILHDSARSQGRQVSVRGDALIITDRDEEQRLLVDDIAEMVWGDGGAQATGGMGLLLVDRQGDTLFRLDERFVENESEARSFLGWLRLRSDRELDITWRTQEESLGPRA